jgi:hypothetical protein
MGLLLSFLERWEAQPTHTKTKEDYHLRLLNQVGDQLGELQTLYVPGVAPNRPRAAIWGFGLLLSCLKGETTPEELSYFHLLQLEGVLDTVIGDLRFFKRHNKWDRKTAKLTLVGYLEVSYEDDTNIF